jgi:1,4-dihydroxy-6-naphthoate synthase
MNRVMRRSVEYAITHRQASAVYVKQHAQEMNEEVIQQHIHLYVNHYSIDPGIEGRTAIETLFEKAHAVGIVGEYRKDIFAERENEVPKNELF